jgi:hypothetical protein
MSCPAICCIFYPAFLLPPEHEHVPSSASARVRAGINMCSSELLNQGHGQLYRLIPYAATHPTLYRRYRDCLSPRLPRYSDRHRSDSAPPRCTDGCSARVHRAWTHLTETGSGLQLKSRSGSLELWNYWNLTLLPHPARPIPPSISELNRCTGCLCGITPPLIPSQRVEQDARHGVGKYH